MKSDLGAMRGSFIKWMPAFALTVMYAAFFRQFAAFIEQGWQAIWFFDELDYGEGIVWQQALSLFSGTAYGPIDQFPAIVYHYTPLYHALTASIAGLGGFDMLVTGRAVSLVATLVSAIFVGLIVARAVPGKERGSVRILAGLAGSLCLFSFYPITYWAPLMRVDMLAAALGVGGIFLGLKALERPKLIHAAALCFVAAVYTKQTSIAAPSAFFIVLLWLHPRLAAAGIATVILSGLTILGTLSIVTDGGFIRHIVFYNINRLDLSRILWISGVIIYHSPLFVGVILAMYIRYRDIRPSVTNISLTLLKRKIIYNSRYVTFIIVIMYFLTSSLTTLMIAKSGSNINYFIEWLIALSMLVGISVAGSIEALFKYKNAKNDYRLLAFTLPLIFAFHAARFEPANLSADWNVNRQTELRLLSQRVKAADRPIISDDMVLLLKNGKQVVWEPAIFAELAHTAIWNEGPFVNRIKKGEFAFFVTAGDRGDTLYDSRYNPAVAAAIDETYPIREDLAGYTLHLPRDKKAITDPVAPAAAAAAH